ncbi:MAG: LacI family DNA-binding transcriptional regulator [Lachnospiraceae bacterium]|nr:LacI family DNA-binding transcriptional regulator [Lachnospiraceae bacterium]
MEKNYYVEKNTSSTIKDVAREAGVSLGTVSKVINGIPVGETYRLRVPISACWLII